VCIQPLPTLSQGTVQLSLNPDFRVLKRSSRFVKFIMVSGDFILRLLSCVLALVSASSTMATAASDSNLAAKIKVAVAMCEMKDGTGYQLRPGQAVNTFERQQNQVIALLKSLVSTWNSSNTGNDSLEFIIVSNTEEGNRKIRDEVNSWRSEYTSFLTLSFRPVQYPAGTNCTFLY